MPHSVSRASLCAGLLALIVTACSPPTSAAPSPISWDSRMVDVGGYRLFLQCSGQGSPTAILESGGGADSAAWLEVMRGIDTTTRVCAYDRANLGRSDSTTSPRTYREMTRDLQALLENADIEGPYILVGWSMGGLLVRVFQAEHPDDVVGIVLVDSAHPDMGLRLLAGLPPASADEPEEIRFLRQWITWASGEGESPFPSPEVDPRASMEELRALGALGDLPLVVISANPDAVGLGHPFSIGRPPLPAETDANLREIWRDLQGELAGLSSSTTRLTAQGGHMIPVEQPELVVEAVMALVNEARARASRPNMPSLASTGPWDEGGS